MLNKHKRRASKHFAVSRSLTSPLSCVAKCDLLLLLLRALCSIWLYLLAKLLTFAKTVVETHVYLLYSLAARKTNGIQSGACLHECIERKRHMCILEILHLNYPFDITKREVLHEITHEPCR